MRNRKETGSKQVGKTGRKQEAHRQETGRKQAGLVAGPRDVALESNSKPFHPSVATAPQDHVTRR